MTTLNPETPLRGGRTTPGVVRVGDTVRRPRTARSPFIRRLLAHLAAAGFEGAPRHLGVDGRGRDVLTFIAGEVPAELGPHDDETLRAAAALIRRFHDLGAGLAAAAASRTGGAEVVCHNDLSPCNFVFRGGAPVAMIDFDAAAPGSRLDDLGYAAWLWLDLGAQEPSPPEQRRRLAIFVEAYGLHDPAAVAGAALKRQDQLIAEAARLGDAAMSEWATTCRAWTQRHMEPR